MTSLKVREERCVETFGFQGDTPPPTNVRAILTSAILAKTFIVTSST